ncbi:MAG: hypothetical protein A2Y15_08025 [Clostridiales bacterium GWF2_36_10]|nr:MAG: hypothetical protein A2Y15_08025 [Clostridiales bacterium GWF2_36_10]HAN20375.1 hypothetical protein [Clostridiales bacterium]
MFDNKKTKNRFENDLMAIKIPEMDKVLPAQSLVPKRKAIKKHSTAFASVQKVALFGVVLILVFTSMNLPLKDVNSPTTDINTSSSDIDSIDKNNSSTDINEVKKVVITAGYSDNYSNISESIPSSKKIYISDMLKSKMEEYKGQDVLFRVIVDIPTTSEEKQNFIDVILYESDEYATEADAIKVLREELEGYKEYLELSDEYYKYIIAVKEGEIELSSKFEKIRKEYDNLDFYRVRAREIYLKIYDIENSCTKKYIEELKIEKIELIKSFGVTEIENNEMTSESSSYFGYYNAYIMELSEEMILTLAEHGGFAFKLAPPERVSGYERKISDSLTVLLEQAKDGDEFHVAVVSVIDERNNFMKNGRYYQCNYKYNSDLYKEWQNELNDELNNENVRKYIDNILVRNNISDKRIYNERHADFSITMITLDSIYIDSAGFEAKLTKDQIIALIADQDVKVIYSMDLIGNDNYAYFDE